MKKSLSPRFGRPEKKKISRKKGERLKRLNSLNLLMDCMSCCSDNETRALLSSFCANKVETFQMNVMLSLARKHLEVPIFSTFAWGAPLWVTAIERKKKSPFLKPFVRNVPLRPTCRENWERAALQLDCPLKINAKLFSESMHCRRVDAMSENVGLAGFAREIAH